MPFSGDTYTVPAASRNDATSGTSISSADYKALLDDLEAALNTTTSIARGGTGGTTVEAAREALGLGDLSFIATADAADDAVMDFTGFDATKYDAYLFVLQNIEPATDAAALYLRTSSDGGATYDSGATDYSWVRRTTSAVITAQSGEAEAARIDISAGVGTGAGEKGISGEIKIFGPHLAKQTSVRASLDCVNNGGNYEMREVVGYRNEEAPVDAIRFLFSTGNIASGSITMYGMRNG